jgi:hypothetical protein
VSRTDAHVPVWVRINRRELIAAPWHASRHDVCDLPAHQVAGPWQAATRCRWLFLGDGHRVCSCEMCYGHTRRRQDVRRERRRTRQQLEASRRRQDALADVTGPHRRRDWWT